MVSATQKKNLRMLKEGREIETVKEGMLKRLIIFNNYFFQLFNFTL
tara:strand:- start:466 stop:603 length:138 start_codon:yes stop_codon:yes gene_type:complete